MPTARHIRGLLRTRQLSPADIRVEGMSSVVVVRSEKAHARIIRVHPPELPPDVRLLDGSTLPARATLRLYGDSVPILARETVRYVGEPIALLVGPDREQLLALREQINVVYEDYEPTFSLDTADASAVAATIERVSGNPDEAFEHATRTLERDCSTGIQEHFYPEAHSAYANFRRDGRIEVTCTTQWPYHVRRTVAETAGVAAARVKVYAVEPGPALDGKLWYPSLVAAHAAIASRQSGRPCLLRLDRSEDLLVTPKRATTRIRQRAALDAEGNAKAVDIDIRYDAGAYPVLTDETLRRMMIASVGAYRVAAAHVRVSALRTNTVPTGPMTGIEAPAWFAAEELAAGLIRETQSDPVEWKRRHIITQEASNHINEQLSGRSPVLRLMDEAAQASDFNRKFSAFELQRKNRTTALGAVEVARGVGMAIGSQGMGFSGRTEELVAGNVQLQLDDEEVVWLYTSSRPVSAGLQSYWKQLISERLGIEPDNVRLASCDTDTVPDSGPTVFSRAVSAHTRLIEQACNAIVSRRAVQRPPITVRRSYRRPKRQKWDHETQSGTPYPGRSWAAAVVEVEVDPMTFEAIVRGVWIAIDAGRILDPASARQTVLSTINHALGWAARRQVPTIHMSRPVETGVGFDPPFRYEPPLYVGFADDHHTERTPALGIGELPWFCVPAAYAHALAQATGIDSISLPAGPSPVYEALERER